MLERNSKTLIAAAIGLVLLSYPYPAGEHFPSDRAHQNYEREYNTRPALRLIRPLRPVTD